MLDSFNDEDWKNISTRYGLKIYLGYCTTVVRSGFRKETMKKIKHNDLTHYFLRDHKDLPAPMWSCQEFFDSLKPQAPSSKPQASSNKQVTSKPDYDIIKTESENI
jgi:hypothetical protein